MNLLSWMKNQEICEYLIMDEKPGNRDSLIMRKIQIIHGFLITGKSGITMGTGKE